MKKLKCYIGNYDGSRQGFVCAKNQKDAAKAINSSVYQMRMFWTQWAGSAPIVPIKPDVLYTKPYNKKYGSDWVEGLCVLKIKDEVI